MKCASVAQVELRVKIALKTPASTVSFMSVTSHIKCRTAAYVVHVLRQSETYVWNEYLVMPPPSGPRILARAKKRWLFIVGDDMRTNGLITIDAKWRLRLWKADLALRSVCLRMQPRKRSDVMLTKVKLDQATMIDERAVGGIVHLYILR